MKIAANEGEPQFLETTRDSYLGFVLGDVLSVLGSYLFLHKELGIGRFLGTIPAMDQFLNMFPPWHSHMSHSVRWIWCICSFLNFGLPPFSPRAVRTATPLEITGFDLLGLDTDLTPHRTGSPVTPLTSRPVKPRSRPSTRPTTPVETKLECPMVVRSLVPNVSASIPEALEIEDKIGFTWFCIYIFPCIVCIIWVVWFFHSFS